LVVNQLNTTATRTFPAFSGLTQDPGDLLVAIIVAYQTSTGTNAAFSSWSHSFTEIHDSATSTTLAMGVAYKWVGGSDETGSLTVTQAGTITGDASMILLSIPGAHASTPPEVSARVSGTSSAADPASFNPAGWGTEDTLWISVVGSGLTNISGSWSATGTTAPSNYGNRVDTNASDTSTIGDCEAAVAFRQLTADSEDVGTAGVDTSNARNGAIVIAVRPVPTITVDINVITGWTLAWSMPPIAAVQITAQPRTGWTLAGQGPPDMDTAAPIVVDIDVISGWAVAVGGAEVESLAIASLAPRTGLAIAGAAPSVVSTTAGVLVDVIAGWAAAWGTLSVDATAEIAVGTITGPALAWGAAPDVATTAQTDIDTETGWVVGWSGLAAVISVVTVAPDTAWGIAAQAPVIVQTGTPVPVDLLTAWSVAASAPVSLGITNPVTVDTITGWAVGAASPPDVTLALVTSLQPPTGSALAVGFGAALTITAVDSVDSETGWALAATGPPIVTEALVIAVSPETGWVLAWGPTLGVLVGQTLIPGTGWAIAIGVTPGIGITVVDLIDLEGGWALAFGPSPAVTQTLPYRLSISIGGLRRRYRSSRLGGRWEPGSLRRHF
jgi:hypothetical protein